MLFIQLNRISMNRNRIHCSIIRQSRRSRPPRNPKRPRTPRSQRDLPRLLHIDANYVASAPVVLPSPLQRLRSLYVASTKQRPTKKTASYDTPAPCRELCTFDHHFPGGAPATNERPARHRDGKRGVVRPSSSGERSAGVGGGKPAGRLSWLYTMQKSSRNLD